MVLAIFGFTENTFFTFFLYIHYSSTFHRTTSLIMYHRLESVPTNRTNFITNIVSQISTNVVSKTSPKHFFITRFFNRIQISHKTIYNLVYAFTTILNNILSDAFVLVQVIFIHMRVITVIKPMLILYPPIISLDYR